MLAYQLITINFDYSTVTLRSIRLKLLHFLRGQVNTTQATEVVTGGSCYVLISHWTVQLSLTGSVYFSLVYTAAVVNLICSVKVDNTVEFLVLLTLALIPGTYYEYCCPFTTFLVTLALAFPLLTLQAAFPALWYFTLARRHMRGGTAVFPASRTRLCQGESKGKKKMRVKSNDP